MGQYAYLGCRECQLVMWLGKTIYNSDGKPSYFAIAEQLTSTHIETIRSVIKMFAECAGHDLRVVIEGDPELDEFMEFREIGGDSIDDISFDEYLKDWPG